MANVIGALLRSINVIDGLQSGSNMEFVHQCIYATN